MLLHIDDQQKVESLQDTFNECFPHLKIELFRNQRDFKNDLSIDGSYLLGDVRSIHDRGILELKSWFSAEDVRQLFKKRYGILVKIYKNTGSKWSLLGKNEPLTPPSPSKFNIGPPSKSSDTEEIMLEIPFK